MTASQLFLGTALLAMVILAKTVIGFVTFVTYHSLHGAHLNHITVAEEEILNFADTSVLLLK